MTQSIVCTACGAAVPYGRLSCPECGELLASVAGGRRGGSAAMSVDRAMPDVLHDAQPTAQVAAAQERAPWADEAGARDPDPIIVSGARWSADADGFDALLAESAAPAVHPPAVVARLEPAAAAPGAYVPPPAPAPTLGATYAAGPPAPARAWAGHGSSEAASAGEPTGTPATPTAASATAGDAAEDTTGTVIRWLAVAGSALAAAGMVLPWSSLTVIGAEGVGYFDRWGLAGPGHLLVAAAVLGALGLALLRDRVPAWLGVGLPGPALGGLLLGLVWPYLIGPLGGQLGAWAVALGAALLIGSGIATLILDRHARVGRVV